MHISIRSTLLAGVLAGLAASAPAQAAPDRTVTVTSAAPAATWTSAAGNGLNPTWLINTGPVKGTCGKDVNNYCETTLVHVTADNIGDGSVKFRIDGFTAASDFDLRVYESDPAGTMGTKIGSPTGDVAGTSPAGDLDPRHTGPGDFETTHAPVGAYIDTETNTLDAYFLIAVPYFTVANDKYSGHATLTQTAPVAETE